MKCDSKSPYHSRFDKPNSATYAVVCMQTGYSLK